MVVYTIHDLTFRTMKSKQNLMIILGSPQEPFWRRENPDGWSLQPSSGGITPGTTRAHQMADRQDYGLLTKILDEEEHLTNEADENGWIPLHVSLRGYSEAIVELLIERGSNINAKTKHGQRLSNWRRNSKEMAIHL